MAIKERPPSKRRRLRTKVAAALYVFAGTAITPVTRIVREAGQIPESALEVIHDPEGHIRYPHKKPTD